MLKRILIWISTDCALLRKLPKKVLPIIVYTNKLLRIYTDVCAYGVHKCEQTFNGNISISNFSCTQRVTPVFL
jgi:hypothetical protein